MTKWTTPISQAKKMFPSMMMGVTCILLNLIFLIVGHTTTLGLGLFTMPPNPKGFSYFPWWC